MYKKAGYSLITLLWVILLAISVIALIFLYQVTPYPSGSIPDQVLLTWSEDPATSQTIQWRTGMSDRKSVVTYLKKADFYSSHTHIPNVTNAHSKLLWLPYTINDPINYRHTAVLAGLEPDTTYVYAVSSDTTQIFSPMAEFTTAPATSASFSFIYMGDVQNGYDEWRKLLYRSHKICPKAAFHIIAGDLVDRGFARFEWDQFFYNARKIYDKKPLVPALGNHEYQLGEPWLYQRLFTLPQNGPSDIEPQKAYSFQYSNALFIILDSNLPPETQTQWLEVQLARTDAVWKFVVFHHPVYPSSKSRDNPTIRTHWTPLFDTYHVDMALQGHDHAYMRTYPMRGGNPVATPAEGTIYIVSVAGSKFYGQGNHDYIATGITNTATFQVIDIETGQYERLTYRAYDVHGTLLDKLVIEK